MSGIRLVDAGAWFRQICLIEQRSSGDFRGWTVDFPRPEAPGDHTDIEEGSEDAAAWWSAETTERLLERALWPLIEKLNADGTADMAASLAAAWNRRLLELKQKVGSLTRRKVRWGQNWKEIAENNEAAGHCNLMVAVAHGRAPLHLDVDWQADWAEMPSRFPILFANPCFFCSAPTAHQKPGT